MANLAPEQQESFKNRSQVTYQDPRVNPKKMLGMTDSAYQDSEGRWWTSEKAVNLYLKEAKKKFFLWVV